MVVYEVNLAVNPDIADDYARWLAGHIQEMLQIEGFFRARWYSRDPDDEGAEGDGRALWTVHYDVYTRADLERYFRCDAQRMRGDAIARFGPDAFEASRRILVPRSLSAPAGETKGA